MSIATPSAGNATHPPQGLTPTHEQIVRHLRHASAVAERATLLGHHPFGAILVGPDQESVLMEQGNVDTVNHAEAVLARVAALNFTSQYLWSCTLYTTVEPCCMCAGTAYWANIGRVVYGMSNTRLLQFTGGDPNNAGYALPCRDILLHGYRPITVLGPLLEDEAAQAHQGYWH